MTEFQEQLVLLVTDKLLLGAIVGGGALLGQWLIEQYKAREETAGKLAEERVKVVAGLCVDLGRVQSDLLKLNRRTLKLILEAGEYLRDPKGKIARMAEQRHLLTEDEYDQLLAERMGQTAVPELAPRLDKLLVQIEQLEAQIDENYFWLAETVTALLRVHLQSVRDVHSAFSKPLRGDPTKWESLHNWAEAQAKRLDINQILPLLRPTAR